MIALVYNFALLAGWKLPGVESLTPYSSGQPPLKKYQNMDGVGFEQLIDTLTVLD